MESKPLEVCFLVVILVIILAGCGSPPAVTTEPPAASAAASVTPDPCAAGQIQAAVEQVNRHMREFDDAALLASSVSGQQLGSALTSLQEIRQEADAEQVPGCLTRLKAYQIEHMNSVINTLLAFVKGTDQKTIDAGVDIARQQHDQYTLELARLLGLPVAHTTAVVVSTPTATARP